MDQRVSVLLATAGRPEYLRIALRCLREQSLQDPVEIIVIADDDRCLRGVSLPRGALTIETGPVDVGVKLATGLEVSRGNLILKMDDDDWYGASYLQAMVDALQTADLVFAQPFLVFELDRWRISRTEHNRCSGATIGYRRDRLPHLRFRHRPNQEDEWLIRDAVASGAIGTPVDIGHQFLQCRHADLSPHLWTHVADGRTVESYLATQPEVLQPEEILPTWALAAYRDLVAD